MRPGVGQLFPKAFVMVAPDNEHERAWPIAIVGMAGRFPGATDIDALWSLLARGGASIGPVPSTRWDARTLDGHGRAASVGGFLQDLELFDARAFGVSARAAVDLDPRHRLLLETSLRALEDAGVPAGALAGTRTGVYVAAGAPEFPLLRAQQGAELSAEGAAAGALDALAQALARHFSLRGPGVTVAAGAAGSLVALHLACRAIESGEIDAALVAGAQVLLVPTPSIELARAGLLSPSGSCRAFGAGADGYVRGEGAVCLFLEPRARALSRGRRVHAHLVRSEVAHDGGTDDPSDDLARLLRRAHAGIAPNTLAYVEAHGEGSARGDAAEIAAIARALATGRDPALGPLPIGSLKPNVGHLGPAAGLAGVVKAARVLAQRRVPPSLFADPPAPALAREAARVCVASAGLTLPDGALHAGISALGGGTLAHVVLRRAEPREPRAAALAGPCVVAISARDEDALARHAERLADALVDTRATLSAVAGTLAHRRDHFAARAAFVARDGGELAVRLRAYARDHDAQAAPARGARGDSVYGTAARVGRVAFAFSGRAIGWGEVGARLFADSAPFAAAVRRTAAALRPHVDWDPIAAVVGGASDRAAVDVRLPVAWAVSVALAALYREAGIAPDVVIGHGAGELAAASVAGILDDADAARLIVARARMPAAPAVLTVGLSLDDARARLAAHSGRIALAAHDGPRACTLAGEIDAIAAVEAELSAAGTFCRRLPHEHVTYDPQGAYDPRDLCEVIRPRAGGTTMMSTVDGSACDGARLDARYWLRDAHATARFADAVRGALDADVTHLVELSPLPALFGVLAQIAAERDPPPRVLAALRSDDDVARGLARALAQAYVAGLAPFGLLPRDTLVPLPGQTLSPRRHWLAPRVQRVADRVPDVTLAPSPVEPGTWEGTRTIDASSPPWLRDLRVHGQRVLPPAALLACALAAARARFALPSALSDLRLDAPALVSDGPRTLGVALRDDSPEGGSLRIASRASGEATWHALARARVERAGAEGAPDFPGDLCRRDAFDARTFYALLRARGHDYGTSLRGVARVYVAAPRALGELHLPAACVPGLGAEALHPTLISAALQVVLALSEEEVTLGPSAVTRVCPLVAPSAAVTSAWVYVVRRGPRHFDLTLYDAERVPRLRLDGLRLAEHPLRAPAPRFPERVLKLRFHRAPACAPQSEGSHWLVCGAREDGAEQVSAALRALGHEVTRAAARLDSPLAWRQQLERLEAPPSGIAFLTPRLAPHAQHCDTLRALAALVAAAAKLRTPPHMAIVTTFAQGVCDLDPVIPDGGLYWGFARVLRREHGVLSARVIDCGSDAASIASCATELVSRDGEDQVALRGDRRYVGRLVRGAQALERAGSRVPWQLPTQPFALRTSTRGTLAPRPLSRRAPGPGEVEIAVTAAALGGLALPHGRGLGDGSLAVGDACAGKVVALGADVGALRVGDRVIACAAGTLATHVTVSAQHVQKVPAVLSDAQAAALPCPLLTAWHGLRGVARMTRGERLLVHAAPGGIGLAAVAVARTLGVEVLATAEGDAARARLHALGVSHVFDARTLAWGEQVHAATAGRGVDAVIGASSGAALRLGLELLAEDGHYVAVQRRDAHEDERLALDVFDKGISLSAIDLSALRARRPERFAQLLAEVWSEVAAGRLPPLPLRQVRFAEAAEALRSERPQAQIEALVLTDPESVRSVVPTPRIEGRFRGDATYLVTGGLGALGLALVTFMAARGARTFLLLGRSPPRDAVGNELAALRQGGVVIETAALDVANGTALDALLGAARARLPPIRGVFHAAGLLDDATIDALTPAQLARVLAPKVEGARNLDALTASDPLDMFVLFSSASALLGTAGQAAHAAANGYLDALAEARRRRGLPALSMQWGPFDALGLAAEDAYRAARLSERGVGSVSTDEGFQAMLAFLELDVPVVGYVLLTLSRWFDAHPDAAGQPSWEALREHAGTTAAQEH